MTLKELIEKRAALMAKIDTAETREALDKIALDLDRLDMQIAEARKTEEPIKTPAQIAAEQREAATLSEVPAVAMAGIQPRTRQDEPTKEMEYRTAFMEFVTGGKPIPAELRANQNTKTTDVAAAIPEIVVNRIIETMSNYGTIWAKVNKTAFAAGMKIPKASVKPVATWVAEGATSDRQKTTLGSVDFVNHKLRCEISRSAEVATMSLSAFENWFVSKVSEAMVKAIEASIISGDGATQPKGILRETTMQKIADATPSYKLLTDAEAMLPEAYENGAEWFMSKKTFMAFIGMTDQQKQPIARTNYGINGKPERFLLGRPVNFIGDYIASIDSTAKNEPYAFLFDMSDYTLNTVYDMAIQSKVDWDTEDFLTKAVMNVDGKATDINSLVILTTPVA